jgi:hypothetical protein
MKHSLTGTLLAIAAISLSGCDEIEDFTNRRMFPTTFECEITRSITDKKDNNKMYNYEKQRIFVVVEKKEVGYEVTEKPGISYFNDGNLLILDTISSVELTDKYLAYGLTSKSSPLPKISKNLDLLTGIYHSNDDDERFLSIDDGTCIKKDKLF